MCIAKSSSSQQSQQEFTLIKPIKKDAPDEFDEESPLLRTESLRVYKSLAILTDYDECIDFVESYLNLHTNFHYRTMPIEELQALRLDQDPAELPFRDWISHLLHKIKSPLMLILAVVYLRKALAPHHRDLAVPVMLPSLTAYNRHRVLMVSLILSGKYLMDAPYAMSVWAKVGKNYWSVQDLCRMEEKMLQTMQWRLYVSSEELRRFVSQY
eukprot:TRINITY_DN173_c0_g1::TRINITY_DN173_c0_g1_i1::g.14321::m.14321 TRINITY_DN173_c0_g1::TRINITY_DN173_c0_g1_i1::g.14321  ORF type:complete len:212 (+),score=44.24,Cyclin_N/PF00134.18/3.6e-08,Cyclin/PF08613.6/8.4e-07 TRINITY_DN173_c0_g1_i1:104-739(+)